LPLSNWAAIRSTSFSVSKSMDGVQNILKYDSSKVQQIVLENVSSKRKNKPKTLDL
jgi:hypothetical protein